MRDSDESQGRWPTRPGRQPQAQAGPRRPDPGPGAVRRPVAAHRRQTPEDKRLPKEVMRSQECPAISLCMWLVYFPGTYAEAVSLWAIYWTPARLRAHRRRLDDDE